MQKTTKLKTLVALERKRESYTLVKKEIIKNKNMGKAKLMKIT